MTFEPEAWNIPQELTILAFEDDINLASPYNSGFNLTLESEDMNYDGQIVPDFEVTVEDNDEGECMCCCNGVIQFSTTNVILA